MFVKAGKRNEETFVKIRAKRASCHHEALYVALIILFPKDNLILVKKT